MDLNDAKIVPTNAPGGMKDDAWSRIGHCTSAIIAAVTISLAVLNQRLSQRYQPWLHGEISLRSRAVAPLPDFLTARGTHHTGTNAISMGIYHELHAGDSHGRTTADSAAPERHTSGCLTLNPAMRYVRAIASRRLGRTLREQTRVFFRTVQPPRHLLFARCRIMIRLPTRRFFAVPNGRQRDAASQKQLRCNGEHSSIVTVAE